MDRQLFPSWIVSTAVTHPGNFAQWEAAASGAELIGDLDGLIGAFVVSPRDGARVRVTVDGGDMFRASVFDGELPRSGGVYAVFPKIKFDYESLLHTRQQRPIDVTVRVELDGGAAGEATETCTLRSINDCPFYVALAGRPTPLDIGFMFGAYVNENHPWIDGLLKEALHKGIVGSFASSSAADAIVAQVYAVWSVLRQRGVKYSNITTTSGRSPQDLRRLRPGEVISQHVRFVDDCVSNAQANCADGSVLIASVLRKIGIEPYLVYVPGHMYLAFSVAEAEREIDGHAVRLTHLFGLETTMIGLPDLRPHEAAWAASPRSCSVARPLPWLGAELGGPRFEFASIGAQASTERIARIAALNADDWRNFVAALEHGTANLAAGYVNPEGHPRDIQILRVTDARQLGLMPLAYRPSSSATPPAPLSA